MRAWLKRLLCQHQERRVIDRQRLVSALLAMLNVDPPTVVREVSQCTRCGKTWTHIVRAA